MPWPPDFVLFNWPASQNRFLHNWRHVYRVSVVRRQSQILAILFWMEFAREFSTFSLFFLESPFWWFFADKNKIFVHHCGLANNFLKCPRVESIIISFPSPTILLLVWVSCCYALPVTINYFILFSLYVFIWFSIIHHYFCQSQI